MNPHENNEEVGGEGGLMYNNESLQYTTQDNRIDNTWD